MSVTIFSEIQKLALAQGFNLVGAVAVAEFDIKAPPSHRWQSMWPKAKTILLLATGGRFFWESLTPSEKRRKHAIDVATVGRLRPILQSLSKQGEEARVVFPFRSFGQRVSFVRLAQACGLGTSQTVLGYVLHPAFGPWVSFRAAILFSGEMDIASFPKLFNPCGPCAKPCIEACPALAIGRIGFDSRACQSQLVSSPSCDSVCLSRAACVVGPEHRYGEEESKHRQAFFKRSLLGGQAV